MLELLFAGFVTILEPSNLIYLIVGVTAGVILGAIPGLTATMAIALIIPLTYYMTPVQSFTMIMGAYNGGTFGGSVSAILLGTPGTPAAAATVADGSRLALKGQAGKAIKMALFASVSGCLFSCVVLILIAEPIARYALKFGPAEYTMLMIFSLTIIGSASGGSIIKGCLGGALGLLFGTVGMDIVTSTARFTFDISFLASGINLVVLLIGALACSEIFVHVESIAGGKLTSHLPPPAHKTDSQLLFSEYRANFRTIVRSAFIGCGIGALPGLGPTLAAYIGYDMAKRNSKNREKFGKGVLEGVAAAESANNAVCGANLIPLLALGVPGDAVAAIMIGAFLIQGLTPGPLVFREAPDVVMALYAGLIISNLLLILVTYAVQRGMTRLSQLETTLIFPIVFCFCFVGVYAMNQDSIDLWIMLFFASVGYVLSKFDYPVATVMIGFILSPLLEESYRQAMTISKGSHMIFFNSYITLALWFVTLYSVFVIVRARRKRSEVKI
jgi:putative tricarboxylic transport membrane protein